MVSRREISIGHCVHHAPYIELNWTGIDADWGAAAKASIGLQHRLLFGVRLLDLAEAFLSLLGV
jgi:hypothetical protein